MFFNSFEFAVFFFIVYSLYLLSSHKWQNILLLFSSYVFYGAWDWRFLSLISISTILDYNCGLQIHASSSTKRRKLFLSLSVVVNLSILCFFKYFNFFASSMQDLLGFFGVPTDPILLNIILPVGISFYTFQAMSYTIDIYRKEMVPTNRFFDFALFVSFFPQLVAGPIERAKRLLPQVLSPRHVSLEKLYEGSFLIFWGLFQKVFIADNLAKIVEPVYSSTAPYNGTDVMIAAYAFSFQIFCDFAGYSNIARGLGKCMGFEIIVNFNIPYVSSNPSEFWKRWHISLSSWLRDYIYIPLGGNRDGSIKTYRNLMITMLLGGLWHGAAWTFVIWGAYHGFLLTIYRILRPFLLKFYSPRNAFLKRVLSFLNIFLFFNLVCIGWMLFRASSISQFFQMLEGLFCNFAPPPDTFESIRNLFFFICILILVQILQFWKDDLLVILKSRIVVLKALFYFICFYLLIFYGVEGGEQFIYFQF
ncbi:MAG: MBOAT family protein [Proteobacteria bacterium]|nr:MBOAT family protein [Pseudomonadota bacterium]